MAVLYKTIVKTFALVASICLVACAPQTEKLDEAVIYNGPLFKYKLVRYRESKPEGEVYNVQCSSSQTADSPAAKADIKAGDMIVSVNKAPIENFNDIAQAIRSAPAGPIKIQLVRTIEGSARGETKIIDAVVPLNSSRGP